MTAPARDSTPAEPWAGRLALTPGIVIYSGPGGEAELHAHHSIQLILSFGSPFELIVEGETKMHEAALVPSGSPHAFRSDGSPLLIALIEPLGPRGADLNDLAKGLENHGLEDRVSPDPGGIDDPIEVVRSTLEDLLPARPSYPILSPHVTAALAYLDEAIDGRPSLEDAAATAGISASRLTHLFTAEIGIPFRNFVLWLRLRRVVDEISAGANLTEAAFAAGFSDSPHLSKVFRDHFGQSPSALLGMTVVPDAWPG